MLLPTDSEYNNTMGGGCKVYGPINIDEGGRQ